MTDTITRIDWQAARARLASVTDDPAVLAGLDRMRKTGDFDDAFAICLIPACIERHSASSRSSHSQLPKL